MRKLVAKAFSLYLRYLPLRRGKKRLSRWIGPLCEGIPLRTAYGFPMHARFQDNTNRLCFEGRADVVTDFIKEVPQGAVFIDVGANQGAVALQAARRVGPDGVVLAFEPSSQSVARLKANISLNGTNNVRVYQRALGAKQKIGHLGTPDPPHSGAAFIGGGEETVAIGPLNDLPQAISHLDDRPVFVKIDTEGYELEALKGMTDLLERRKVQALIVEMDDKHLQRFGVGLSDVYEFLEGFGYRSQGVPRQGHYDVVFTLTDRPGYE